jgi:hypothetical protein
MSWAVSGARTPGLEVKFTLFPKKQFDAHCKVVKACTNIAWQHKMNALVQKSLVQEAQEQSQKAIRFADSCLSR